MKPVIIALLLSVASLCGQTCTITSPTSGAFIQTVGPMQLSATVSSAPSAYKLIWSVDYQRWASGYVKDQHPAENAFRDVWQGPWTVTWYSGLQGDGQHVVSGALFDIFGTELASCAAVTFTVRIMGMSNQSVNAFPTSGRGEWGMKTFDGSNAQSNGNASQSIDGYPLPYDNYCGGAGASAQSGGWQVPSFNTACFPNGPHLALSNYYAGSIADPYMLPLTFTSSNVSGNNIGISNHYSYQGSVVTFSTTGTLPSPLVAGCQYSSQTSATNSNTASYSIASGVISVTLSAGCNLAPGTPVLLRNIHSNDPNDGQPLCDGFFSMATGSGTAFTVMAPAGCPNIGAANPYTFEVDVNPYFVNYIDANTISVSASPGGATVTLTGGGSGTHTVLQRIRSPYWGYSDFVNQNAIQNTNAPAYVLQQVTFSNGNAPMRLNPLYWEMHLIAGAGATPLCNSSKLIANTDLSFSALACNATGVSWSVVSDGGLSGVCSVDSSGNVTGIMAGWCQVLLQCSSCAAGSVSLPPVTTYVQVHSGSITFPHFTHSGAIASAFTPGSSFFPLSTWHLNVIYSTPYNGVTSSWLGPMMQESNLNSSMITGNLSNNAFGDAANTACFSSSWPSSIHGYESAFAAQYGTYFEAGIETTHWGFAGAANLAALLNNVEYNRQTCLTGFLSQLVSEGRTWRTYGYDELNAYMAGSYPFRNPNLGSTTFPSIVVSAGVATYNVSEQFTGTWSQSAGTGSWIKMAGAVTNTCLNGWFPVTGVTNNGAGYPVSFTTPSACANGSYTESTAQLYHYWVSSASPGGENASALPSVWGTSTADNTSGNACCVQGWGSQLTQIVINGSGVATVTYNGHAIPNGTAIRIHGSIHNLNVVAATAYIDANTFSIAYSSLNGSVPAAGTYNSSNDAGLYVTVDGNLPPTPFLALRNILTSVSGHPATTWPVIGSSFVTGNPAVQNWSGNTMGADAANDYIEQPPYPVFGTDASVWQWANYSQSTSGLATRAYQLPARAMLWSAGLNFNRYCKSFVFNPGCDHPTQLLWRPETIVSQMIAMLTLNIGALRLYNYNQDPSLDYLACCALNSGSTGDPYPSIGPYTAPKQWSAMAHTDALIKLREDTELQPPANKPYMGPFFLTDAHLSPTYGNELKILCASEMPYGSQTVSLPSISGGSMIKYVLDGYSLAVKVLTGNPSTDTDEFCGRQGYPAIPSPGRATTYVALPPAPAVQPIDNIAFAPPSTLPFGATKFLIQVGYYPRAMQDDPVTDCSSGCTIAVDHHNTNAWYRAIYANSNSIPLSVSDPIKIPSQGLN
jgi:hypothetical protein